MRRFQKALEDMKLRVLKRKCQFLYNRLIQTAASISILTANDLEAHSLNTYITVYRYVRH
jgi:hypothetical protein